MVVEVNLMFDNMSDKVYWIVDMSILMIVEVYLKFDMMILMIFEVNLTVDMYI
jgi:hypothetical protein